MRYIFENENALEIYYIITKEMNINMKPGRGFKDEVYLSEKFMTECLEDVHKQKLNKKECNSKSI